MPPGAAPAVAAGRPGGNRSVRYLRAVWPPALVLAAVFALWWVVAAAHWVPDYLVPTPPQVFDLMRDQWADLMHHSWVTLYETLLGFGLAVVLGLGTAGYGTEEGIEAVNREQVFGKLEKILASVKIQPVDFFNRQTPISGGGFCRAT